MAAGLKMATEAQACMIQFQSWYFQRTHMIRDLQYHALDLCTQEESFLNWCH
jgi:hypothetical protein